MQRGPAYSAKISPTSSVYITVPIDGYYGDEAYEGSGRTVTQILAEAFYKHLNSVKQALEVQSDDEAMAAAKTAKVTYIVFSTILHWENRATEWSGRPDRITLRVTINDVATGSVISVVTIQGKSGIATFGGDQPQDLLPVPVNKYVNSLFDDAMPDVDHGNN